MNLRTQLQDFTLLFVTLLIFNTLISDVDVDETEINSSKLYAKNMLQVVDKKRRDGKTSKQDGRCGDVIVNELLDAQAATIGAWKLDNVIDQVSLENNDQPKSNRSLSSKISNAIKGILDMKHVNQTANVKKFGPPNWQLCQILLTKCQTNCNFLAFKYN